MEVKYIKYILVLLLCTGILYGNAQSYDETKSAGTIKVGAERTDLYLPLLKDKNIAIVANQTSMIKNTHLVDSLVALNLKIQKVFAPEHGFRGEADAGEKVKNATDGKTGLTIVSLYGNHTKPTARDLEGIDLVIYDIQDVGVRFYTFISTMQYVMEACAENNVAFLILDRPNPNGFYVDGPILESKYKSFVGLHPIPIVYGLTAAEYGYMLNGEYWLKDSVQCKLMHIPVEGYTHSDFYELPLKPSPNLPTMSAVYLYPSLGLFEGTVVSVGRGTHVPFQVIGHPGYSKGNFKFTPRSVEGAAKNPPFRDELCKGLDLSGFDKDYFRMNRSININWIKDLYHNTPNKKKFFNSYFNKLAGNATLKEQIMSGKSVEEIRKSWQEDLTSYKIIRKKYLLYTDFE